MAENLSPSKLRSVPIHHIPLSSVEYCPTSELHADEAPVRRVPGTMHTTKHSSASTLKRVLVEWRPPVSSKKSISETNLRLNQLVQMLQHMASWREPAGGGLDFGALRCVGWMSGDPAKLGDTGLVYEFPDNCASNTPESLIDWINKVYAKARTNRTEQRKALPSLSDRLALAVRLGQIYGSLLAVGCLHRSLCSHNILLFDTKASSAYLAGYTSARSEHMINITNSVDGNSAVLDLYRTGDASAPISSVRAEVYALGIVFLEIGLWRTAESIKGGASLSQYHAEVVCRKVDQVAHWAGSIYQQVIRDCLSLSIPDSGDIRDAVAWYTKNVVERFSLCRA
ncbi:hypothetical protein BJX64DRAFT_283705 [Aspergillus heterothallicus]